MLGTGSFETVLPRISQKMGSLSASKAVAGLVTPSGYSVNLDGTNTYMTLVILFLAQAMNTDLTLGQEVSLLAIATLTSMGTSGVTGAGFITLAATLAIIPDIPIQSLALTVGIDKFMSECRALTNLVGNWGRDRGDQSTRRKDHADRLGSALVMCDAADGLNEKS